MSAAYIDEDGNITQLDARDVPDEVFSPDDAQDPEKVARVITRLIAGVAELKRRRDPRVLYFRDRPVTASLTTMINLEHGFGGRVNWSPQDWQPTTPGTEIRLEKDDERTDANTLVLVSNAAGTVTIRVEEAG